MGMRGLNPVIRLSRWLAGVSGKPRLAFGPRWIWAAIVKTQSSSVKWQELVSKPGGFFFGEKTYGHFRPALQTADKKIIAAPEEFVKILQQRLAEPLPQSDSRYSLQIISRRRQSMMNSWLVESSKHPRIYGDYVEINAADAAARQLQDDQQVIVASRVASVKARVRITEDMSPGIVGIDQGWGSRLFDPQGGEAPELRGVMRNTLVAADEIDELAGAPNLNGTQVEIAAVC